ncbi:hypothetical protein ACRRTK_019551 [Alexandromys fortis]
MIASSKPRATFLTRGKGTASSFVPLTSSSRGPVCSQHNLRSCRSQKQWRGENRFKSDNMRMGTRASSAAICSFFFIREVMKTQRKQETKHPASWDVETPVT